VEDSIFQEKYCRHPIGVPMCKVCSFAAITLFEEYYFHGTGKKVLSSDNWDILHTPKSHRQ
jgi:hypothetical protein